MWLLTTVNHHPLALSLMNGVFLGVREYDLPTQKISLMTLLATNMPASAIFDDDFLQLPQVKQTASFTLERSISLQTTFFPQFGFPARRWIQSIPPEGCRIRQDAWSFGRKRRKYEQYTYYCNAQSWIRVICRSAKIYVYYILSSC